MCQGAEQQRGGGGDGGSMAVLWKREWEGRGVCGEVLEACREVSGISLWQDGPSGSNMGSCVDKMFEELCWGVAPQMALREEDGH